MLSEKMMEGAISSEPEKYLGEKGLRLIARQYSIGSYVFDLLFEDRHGSKLIVELQKGTLDRTHTYKILDYYDEYKGKHPNDFIELMVIANRIPHERRRRLESHGISWKEIAESEFADVIGPDIESGKNNINLGTKRQIMSKDKIVGGYGSEEVPGKMLITNFYDKVGNILSEMLSDRGTANTFTAGEVYELYARRYPDDEEFMKKRKEANPRKLDLRGWLPGMVWEYSRKDFGSDPDKPAIQFLRRHTYRFI
jgi:hypothetical protein